jgi:hypothetical protein
VTAENLTPLGYLSDQETKVDLLNNEAIAKTIVRLINETVDSAVTIGVHGDWGAGKSSVLEMPSLMKATCFVSSSAAGNSKVSKMPRSH